MYSVDPSYTLRVYSISSSAWTRHVINVSSGISLKSSARQELIQADSTPVSLRGENPDAAIPPLAGRVSSRSRIVAEMIALPRLLGTSVQELLGFVLAPPR